MVTQVFHPPARSFLQEYLPLHSASCTLLEFRIYKLALWSRVVLVASQRICPARWRACGDARQPDSDGEANSECQRPPLPDSATCATPPTSHMSFEVGISSQKVIVIGDALNNHHVAFRKPQWISEGLDQDPKLAADTRKKLLDKIVSEQSKVVGFHLPNGGIGQVEKIGKGYNFVNT